MSKKNEWAEKSAGDLRDAEVSLRKELFDLEFKHATRQLGNPMEVRAKRRDLARVLTAQTQKKHAK